MRFARAAWLMVLALVVGAPAGADTLFWEDFNGYHYFPAQDPLLDWVNPGVPLQSEGANEEWFGGRFMTPDSACVPGSTIDCDLAVQQFGNVTTNPTPVGRFEDEAGLLFRVDTANYEDVLLEFDWRTFSATSGDMVVVGYFVGDIPELLFNGDKTADLTGGPYDWTNWVQLDSLAANTAFSSESYALPTDAGIVWVAFWMNDGEGDYGKIDNVLVTGNYIPEPSTALLLASGLIVLGAHRRRSR